MRKLASIQAVSLAEPIPNADAIERIRVLGWWVVVKKGEFQVGDTVVYCEVDSLLPERSEFEFLRTSSFKPAVIDGETVVQRAGFRIKTVKLRGQVSQGICFPLSILPPGAPSETGADVTAFLDIIKYEPPLPVGMGGKVKGGFPDFLGKTDEIRVQVLEPVLARHRGKPFYVTEKLDGTSCTVFLKGDEFGVCSRNLWMDESDETNILVRLAKRLDLPARLRKISQRLGVAVAIQGEAIGPGIQKNRYELATIELHVFNLVDLDSGRLVDLAATTDVLAAVGLSMVPYLGEIVLDHSVDQLVEFSIGKSLLNPRLQREGVVLRPLSEEYDPDVGGRLSFKVINPQFLLKYDE
jgi:RNA ligase (TIGR02306 family)